MNTYSKQKSIIAVLIASLCSMFCITANAVEIPENAYAVISIPAIDVKMPVYISNTRDNNQNIIDMEYSALLDRWGTAYQILDHSFSEDPDGNEWNIQKIFPGAYAWLYTEDATYFLECYETAKTKYDGNEYINGRLLTPASSYDILLACCAEDAQHHFVALFRRIATY